MSRFFTAKLIVVVVALLPVLPGRADPLLTALEGELQRSMELLTLPDSPRPYYMAYTMYDMNQAFAQASHGALIKSVQSQVRPLRVEVRVGGYEHDNSNFSTFGEDPSGVGGASLVLDNDPVAIGRDLWIVTDEAYKSAVEGLSMKAANREQLADEERPPDYTAAPPVVSVDPTPPAPVDLPRMEQLARALSARVRSYPEVEHSKVYASDASWRRILVTSEGTRISDSGRMTVVRLAVDARSSDGRLSKDTCSWLARSPSELPSDEALVAEVDAMLARLRATAAAPLSEDYLGPVVFEGQASAELFRQLLVPQLMGTPSEESGSDWGMGSTHQLARLGRRVLPDGYSVIDDPTRDGAAEIGHYLHDHEGIPAQAVELVQAGVVTDLLMSRTPRDEIEESNGHGRGSTASRIVGLPGVLEVQAGKTVSMKKLRKQALKMARQSGRDHVLVVRTLDDPSLVAGVRIRRIRFDNDGGLSLTAPLEVVRLYADGREEPVRDTQFLFADHRILRDIVATAAGSLHHGYLAPAVLHGGTAWVSGPTTGLAVTIQAPQAVLVSEMELDAGPASTSPPPLVPGPFGALPTP